MQVILLAFASLQPECLLFEELDLVKLGICIMDRCQPIRESFLDCQIKETRNILLTPSWIRNEVHGVINEYPSGVSLLVP